MYSEYNQVNIYFAKYSDTFLGAEYSTDVCVETLSSGKVRHYLQ